MFVSVCWPVFGSGCVFAILLIIVFVQMSVWVFVLVFELVSVSMLISVFVSVAIIVFVSISVFVSIFVSVSVVFSLLVYVFVVVSVSVSVSLFLSLYLSLSLLLSVFVSVFVSVSVSFSVFNTFFLIGSLLVAVVSSHQHCRSRVLPRWPCYGLAPGAWAASPNTAKLPEGFCSYASGLSCGLLCTIVPCVRGGPLICRFLLDGFPISHP